MQTYLPNEGGKNNDQYLRFMFLKFEVIGRDLERRKKRGKC